VILVRQLYRQETASFRGQIAACTAFIAAQPIMIQRAKLISNATAIACLPKFALVNWSNRFQYGCVYNEFLAKVLGIRCAMHGVLQP
jgi:hypothetical protein